MKPLFFAPVNDNPSLAEQVAALKKVLNAAGNENLIEPRDFVAV